MHALDSSLISRPNPNGGGFFVPAGLIGNNTQVDIGTWRSSHFEPMDMEDWQNWCSDNALDRKELKCDMSWNCCGGPRTDIVPLIYAYPTGSGGME